MDDAVTALALSTDGGLLYGASAVKIDGYQYCGQAIALSPSRYRKKDELRQRARAVSQVGCHAQQSKDDELLARAYRDLAIVYGYAGDYEKNAAFAKVVLAYPVRDPTKVVGPKHKMHRRCRRATRQAQRRRERSANLPKRATIHAHHVQPGIGRHSCRGKKKSAPWAL